MLVEQLRVLDITLRYFFELLNADTELVFHLHNSMKTVYLQRFYPFALTLTRYWIYNFG